VNLSTAESPLVLRQSTKINFPLRSIRSCPTAAEKGGIIKRVCGVAKTRCVVYVCLLFGVL
jgi:hypothetical protein